MRKYGYDGTKKPVNVFAAANRESTDFGYAAWGVEQWDVDGSVFRGMKALGCDSVFVGHEHRINVSLVYEGVGGTVIPLSAETGRLKQPFIYLNKNAGGDYFAKYNDPCVVTKGYNR